MCSLLAIKAVSMKKLLGAVDENYKQWSEDKVDKNGIPKKYLDGTVKSRTFRNPSVFMKSVQTRIKEKIFDVLPLPDCVHGGVKGRSNITNAKAHQGNKYMFCSDLQEFFPNITSRVVFSLYRKLGYSSQISHWLTLLTTKDDEVPQGSPTSTSVANFVFVYTDNRLMDLCKIHKITYTRYVDDLTFSSQKDFGNIVQKFIDIVIEDGFKISRRKTKYAGHQEVTGINVFLNKIDAPTRILERSDAEIFLNAPKMPVTDYLNAIRKTNK